MKTYLLVGGLAVACSLGAGCGKGEFAGNSGVKDSSQESVDSGRRSQTPTSSSPTAENPSIPSLDVERGLEVNWVQSESDTGQSNSENDEDVGSDGDDQSSDSPDSDDELANACNTKGKSRSKKLMLSGSKTEESHEITSDVAIKVTGNFNILKLKVPANAQLNLTGICIFVTGNQNQVQLDIAGKVNLLTVKGRGNQVIGTITVEKAGSLSDSQFDLSGNAAEMRLQGDGNYSCAAASGGGNNTQIKCLKQPT